VFEHIFGGGGGGFGARMRGRPMLRTAMRISFTDAVKGATKTVDLSSLGIPGMARKTVELAIPAGARCCAGSCKGGRVPLSSPGQSSSSRAMFF
jgi:hypothetical protein